MTQYSFSQSSRKKGDQAWSEGKIKTAVNHYSQVKNIDDDKELLAKRGLGYFKLNKLKRAVSDFTKSKQLGNQDPELYFLMAQTKQHLNQYEEAVFFYKAYLKEASDKSFKGQLALREIKNCVYSAFHKNDASTAFVENFGEQVNSYYDEVYALQSPQFGNWFYFSSNRNLINNDVYAYSLKANGQWKEEVDFDEKINTSANEYVMDISTDGQSMLFTRTTGKELATRIYVSTFDEAEEQHIVELPEYLLDGAIDLQIVDYNTIAFASKDLGGYGGYDIFTINYKNGVWSDPINEGLIINTEYDERSPCFASNSEYLYFSSNRPYCYGGFDVYYYNKLGIAPEPTNMGAPINTSGNDLHFRLNTDGQMAVMSSDRKTGAGAYDIYQVYMQDFKVMPPKDKRQLEYLKDYFNYITPKEEVAVEPQTHLDKLKEKIDVKEPTKDNEDKTDVATTEEETTTTLEEEKEESTITTTVTEIVPKTPNIASEQIDSNTPVEEIDTELVDVVSPTNTTDKDVEDVDAEETNTIVSEEEQTEVVQIKTEEQVDKTEDSNTLATVERTIEATELETKKDLEPTSTVVTNTSEEKRPKKNYTTVSQPPKSNPVTGAIPQPESGESPLEAIKQQRQATETYQIKEITGNKYSNTIFYQDRHDLMNDLNRSKLDELIRYMKTNLNHSVHFVAFTDHLELGLPEYMQYNTLKRANLLAKYLQENGVGYDRISIESVCSNYPFARPEVAGKINEDYLAYNKRIDWELRDESKQVLKSHNIKVTDIPSFALDRKYELYTQIREELYYSVEIADSPRIHKNAILRLFTDIYIRKATATANNKYYIGLFNNYAAAVELEKKLKESSASYAKIVPFYNGMPITADKLKAVAKDYPDLNKFISAK